MRWLAYALYCLALLFLVYRSKRKGTIDVGNPIASLVDVEDVVDSRESAGEILREQASTAGATTATQMDNTVASLQRMVFELRSNEVTRFAHSRQPTVGQGLQVVRL